MPSHPKFYLAPLVGLVIIGLALSASAQPLLDVHELERQVGSTVVFVRAYQQSGTSSEGSGLVVTSNGWIVTNQHVIGDASDVEVWIRSPREFHRYRALVVASDPYRDLAVLRVDASGLLAAELARPGEVAPGLAVASLGYPEGIFNVHRQMRIVAGVVSHTGFPLADIPERRWIVSDVRLREGNSGGPLFDGRGRVVGINTIRRLDGETSLSIPIEEVLLMVADLTTMREQTLNAWRHQSEDIAAEIARIGQLLEQRPQRTGSISRSLVREQMADCERLLEAAATSTMTGRWVQAREQLDGTLQILRWIRDVVGSS